ncbi:MAG: long-chain-fatty-acid--CoA ligase [Rhodoblastus sp.]|jgi:long-chain acyl-CoA synthetase|nr:long-chain-fatty-acid--CoA ligase [Rhodoblastus sp.]MCC0004628.1 long-chain-fatty-acid--CoA ligase [Methylobacteriaceae bacterium]
MDKIWLKSYPPNVPADVDTSAYASLAALFEDSFKKYANDKAYVCMDKAITFGDIDRMSRDFGAYLQGRGLKQGDRVAIMMPNVLQYPVALAAVLRAGFIAVNVNPLYTPRELEHQLKDSGSTAIVVLENFASVLQEALPKTQVKHIIVASMGDMLGFPKGAIVNFVVRRKMVPAWSLPGHVTFKAALAQGAGKPFSAPAMKREDVAILQYTGGTTGVSKGAVLTHGALLAAVLASEAWLQPAMSTGKIKGQIVSICALPLYHVFALVSVAFLAMRLGGLCVLIPNPRDLPGLIKEMGKYRFNTFPAVNTLFNGLVNNPEFAKLDFSGLAVSNGGGMAVQEAVAKKWFAITGCPIIEGYGLSETCSGVTCNRADSDKFTGTIGLPMPGVEIKILDDDGNEVKHGEPGEIAIRAPMNMSGYWNRPDETAKVMTADNFFRSGDIGTMDDDGYLRIVDRKKDMILVSGFNVYPNEVEAAMAEHPDVLECAVVGLPDSNSGEKVALYVVPKKPVSKEELAKFAEHNLAGYKRPRVIEFRQTLPKTNVGKILRRELRDEALKETAK